MIKELYDLASYLEEHREGYFLTGDLNRLEGLIAAFFQNPQTLDLESQEEFFRMSTSCYPLFSTSLRRDLNFIPEFLRYSLLSKCFYGSGTVEIPENIDESEVNNLLEESACNWYENDSVGYRIYNLRENVLNNPSLDLEILTEEFNNSGDVGNIQAILRNPVCPESFLHQIIDSNHPYIFEDEEHLDLIEETKKILSSRLT